jgi:hypothetical protein
MITFRQKMTSTARQGEGLLHEIQPLKLHHSAAPGRCAPCSVRVPAAQQIFLLEGYRHVRDTLSVINGFFGAIQDTHGKIRGQDREAEAIVLSASSESTMARV